MLPFQQKLRELLKYLLLPQRFIFCYFSLLAITNATMMRLCLDFSLNQIALECATKPATQAKRGKTKLSQLPSVQRLEQVAIKLREHILKKHRTRQKGGQILILESQKQKKASKCDQVWTTPVKTWLTIVYFAGYMLTHIPGGRCAERYGGKWVLGVAILLAAIFTLLTPMAVHYGGPRALIAIRLLIGLCEGITFPAVSAMMAQWVPTSERGKLGSFVLSGDEIGIASMQFISGLLVQEQQDWPLTFYVVGSCGILWFLGYSVLCSSKPDACPFIQHEERNYIKQEVSDALLLTASTTETPPWNSILSSTSLWALVTATIQYNWNELTDEPAVQHVLQELKDGSTLSSFYVALPHLCNWLASLTTGTLSDFLIAKKVLSRTVTRRLISCVAFPVFTSISMFLVYDNAAMRRVWHVLGAGAYYAGIKLLPLDMSPNYAGTLMAIANGLGALPGLLSPYLEQIDDENAVLSTVRAGLWLICASYISGDVQSYNGAVTN